MSYAEYSRRKAAATPIIIDTTPKKVDSSFYTSQKRMEHNRIFHTSTRMGVVNNAGRQTTTPYTTVQSSVNVKLNGGSIPDASTFTSYMGGLAIGNRANRGPATTRLVANSNDGGSISRCRPMAEPAPYIPGGSDTYTPNMVPQTASSFTNNTKHCEDLGRTQPHIESELGPSLFVDNMRPGIPASNTCQNGEPAPCKHVIHTHPTIAPHPSIVNRTPPTPMGTQLSTDINRKLGSATPNLKYIEKHHGNPTVNRPVYGRYKPSRAPAQLKINDPISSRPK
jgi:hypothetical protein